MWAPKGYVNYSYAISHFLFNVGEEFVKNQPIEWLDSFPRFASAYPGYAIVCQEDDGLTSVVSYTFGLWAFHMLSGTRYMQLYLCDRSSGIFSDTPIGELLDRDVRNFNPFIASADAYMDQYFKIHETGIFGIDPATGLVSLPKRKSWRFRQKEPKISSFFTGIDGLYEGQSAPTEAALWKEMRTLDGRAACYLDDEVINDPGEAIRRLCLMPSVAKMRSEANGQDVECEVNLPDRPNLTRAQQEILSNIDRASLRMGGRQPTIAGLARTLGYDRKTVRAALRAANRDIETLVGQPSSTSSDGESGKSHGEI